MGHFKLLNEYYISFGFGHGHNINGRWFDRDTVGVIRARTYAEAREKAFEVFGDKFFTVSEKRPDAYEMKCYYHSGFLDVL